MTPAELQSYIHTHIPLAAYMQVAVESVAADRLALSAPLEPSLNVHGSFFGGSGASLGLLAAWALTLLRVESEGLNAPLVVRSQEMRYLKPITGRAHAVATFADTQAWPAFVHDVQQTGRGRILVQVDLMCAGALCAQLTAQLAVRGNG